MSEADAAVIKRGMDSLVKVMGIVDTERFLALMNRKKVEYGKWRKGYFGKMTPEKYEKELFKFAKKTV